MICMLFFALILFQLESLHENHSSLILWFLNNIGAYDKDFASKRHMALPSAYVLQWLL